MQKNKISEELLEIKLTEKQLRKLADTLEVSLRWYPTMNQLEMPTIYISEQKKSIVFFANPPVHK